MDYKDITLAECEEHHNYGFNVICDGDNKNIKFGASCNHCSEYFTSDKIFMYCDNCINLNKNIER